MQKKSSANIFSKLNKLLENTLDLALKRRAHTIVVNLDPQTGQAILDVGCGDGFYLYLLSNLRLKLKLYGADIDRMALDYAGKRISKKILLKQADLMKRLPFKDKSFDAIIMSEVVEHLSNPSKGLSEVYRVLKPNGILCLSVPNADYPFSWDPINWLLEHLFGYHIKNGFWAGIWNQHIRLYKKEDIKKDLEETGFVVEKIDVQTFWCLPFNHYLINLGARIRVLGGNLSIVEGSNKFSKSSKKSLLVKTYFFISNLVDKLNNWLPVKKSGVSLVVKAVK